MNKYTISFVVLFVCLILNNSLISNDFRNIRVVDNSSLASFYLDVKKMNGEFIRLRVESSFTINEIKHQLLGKTDILPDQQIIVFKGIQLQDDKTLGNYSIRETDVVYLITKFNKVY